MVVEGLQMISVILTRRCLNVTQQAAKASIEHQEAMDSRLVPAHHCRRLFRHGQCVFEHMGPFCK